MLEILVILALFTVLAAKKGRRSGRRMTGYLKGNVEEQLALGSTLAANTLIATDFDEVVTERKLCSSIVATYDLANLVAGQGPILFGIAHSDYTAAEIEEVIENTGSWDGGNLISQEISKRKIRILGTFVGEFDTGTVDVRWNDGRPVKTKLNWILKTGATLKVWAYNLGANLSTTSPELTVSGHVNLWAK